MKSHKLLHVLALLALVACVPAVGPSLTPPTATTKAVVTTAAPSPTSTSVPASATPTATIAQPTASVPPSPTSLPSSTATIAPSPTSSGPQWGHRTKTTGCAVQGPFPDPACTPGDVFPTVTAAQVCVPGYSSSVRDVPASEKDAVYAEYGITSHSTGQYEIDHFVSLELGGSNDISNLFPEAASPTPGFHEKDKVENYLHSQVCKGAITLAEAQRQIATNWLAVYTSMPAGAGSLPTSTRAPAQATATQGQQVVPTATEAVVAPATMTPAPPAQNCDPSYPDVCIPPPPPDLNCKDIPFRRFKVLPPDPHHFDADHDGIGCES